MNGDQCITKKLKKKKKNHMEAMNDEKSKL